MNNGTPKTIKEAIQNGIREFYNSSDIPNDDELAARMIERHVRDFMAQKFGIPTDDSLEIWRRIFPKDGL